MADDFQYTGNEVSDPARALLAVTPSDGTPLTDLPKALYIGAGGNVAIRAVDDASPVTLVAVPTGAILPIRAQYVYATGTTATSIVALY